MEHPADTATVQTSPGTEALVRQYLIAKACADKLAEKIWSHWQINVSSPSALGPERRRGNKLDDSLLEWWAKDWKEVKGPREMEEIFSRVLRTVAADNEDVPRPIFKLELGTFGGSYEHRLLTDGRHAYRVVIKVSFPPNANQGRNERPAAEVGHKEHLVLPSRWIKGNEPGAYHVDPVWITRDMDSEELSDTDGKSKGPWTSMSYVAPSGIDLAMTPSLASYYSTVSQSGNTGSIEGPGSAGQF